MNADCRIAYKRCLCLRFRTFYGAVTSRTFLKMLRDVAILSTLSAGLYLYVTSSIPIIGGVALAAFLATRDKSNMDVFFKTVGRDLK